MGVCESERASRQPARGRTDPSIPEPGQRHRDLRNLGNTGRRASVEYSAPRIHESSDRRNQRDVRHESRSHLGSLTRVR